ncbi:phosphatidylglycerophosphatase A [uncultured Thiothrix sp.]|uniref:phosphatidylglycerophosphatase A family protein n=1 Tax=uncultured Thiothrix sp. TaxID=223185 RepID=UPI002623CA37|nr:phosphatidylglycerophosphatase A [uncultured Thiothrix sp.]HMT94288.1 phosphatidylglycerophosphatase A [Thiolinea sp.]
MSLAKTVFQSPIHITAFGFGSGLAPFAPGTFGTLAAIPLYLILSLFPLWLYFVVIVIAAVVGIWICGESAKKLGVHDHEGIVWDEFVGFWITMFAAPSGLIWLIAGFVIFRIFDIWKPWPIYIVDDKVQGGFGIMLDDLMAGVYALIVMQILAFFLA